MRFRADRLVVAIALGVVLFHLAFAARYGWFRDELYYVACARRLAWGYVDHPPMVAVFARLALALFGESLVGLRAFAALAAGGTALLAGELAREMGGARFAQGLAAFVTALAPYDLAVGHFYSMNAFEPLVWGGVTLVFVRAANRDDARVLLWLGPIVGLGVLNKHSAAWPVAGLALGMALSPARRFFARREVWIAAAIAALIVLPHLLWQYDNGFPTREFAKNALSGKNEPYGVLGFVWQEALLTHPLAAPLWMGGLAALARLDALRAFRPIAVMYFFVATLIVATQAKAYYLAPSYGALFAAGAVAFERLVRARWARAAYTTVFGLGAAALVPLVVPVLSAADFQRYAKHLGSIGEVKTGEKQKPSALPQLYADMHGWPEMAARVREVALAEGESIAVLADNYGQASAVEMFAHLPVASGNNGWWLWGPPRPPPGAPSELGWPRALVTIGYETEELSPFFADVREAGRVSHPLARADEQDLPICVCRAPTVPIDEAWPRFKRYH
jgi:hypothetical protein